MTNLMTSLQARHLVLLAVAFAACESDEPQTLDPTVTYEVYGERFEPGVAVPAPAVLAEPHVYVGRKVILEGVALDGCGESECLTTIAPGEGGRIHVFLSAENGADFDVPGDISGRRIVVNGRFEEGADSTFHLHASGVMAEKIRR